VELKNALFSLFNRLILIEVYLFNLFGQLVIDIDHPVGCHPGVPAIGLLEDVLFRDFCNSIVIEFSPFVVKSVFNKSIVMTT
jgi:hypothetical protein